jgi:hypothetical protein
MMVLDVAIKLDFNVQLHASFVVVRAQLLEKSIDIFISDCPRLNSLHDD